MKKDPLVTMMTLLHNLSLLEADIELNIHQFKKLFHSDLHWVTIQKYLKIINLVQKYSPEIELNDSILNIKEPKIHNHLSTKEQLVTYLYLSNALDDKTAIPLPEKFQQEEVFDSVGRLYKKTKDHHYFLKPLGIEFYNNLNSMISETILDEKEIEEVFEYTPITIKQPFTARNARKRAVKKTTGLVTLSR